MRGLRSVHRRVVGGMRNKWNVTGISRQAYKRVLITKKIETPEEQYIAFASRSFKSATFTLRSKYSILPCYETVSEYVFALLRCYNK